MPHENKFSDIPAKPMPKINYLSQTKFDSPPPNQMVVPFQASARSKGPNV